MISADISKSLLLTLKNNKFYCYTTESRLCYLDVIKFREKESNLRVTTPLVTEYGKNAHMQ